MDLDTLLNDTAPMNDAEPLVTKKLIVLKNENPTGLNGLLNDAAHVDDVEPLHATALHHPQIILLNRGNPNSNIGSKQPKIKNEKMAKISPKPGTISTIIRSYKSAVSNKVGLFTKEFAWHGKFHDHIIRDGESFRRIQDYIINNPKNWKYDKFYRNSS